MEHIKTYEEYKADREFAENIGYMIVEIDEATLVAALGNALNEGQWRTDQKSGLMYRVDPAMPQWNGLRHVHIADSKHKNAKAKQVSWNDDGSRHDRISFNTNFKALQAAKDVARRVLKLRDDVVLEQKEMKEGQSLLESLEHGEFIALVLEVRAKP